MLYVDTSVLVAYYSPEPLSPKAQEALRSGQSLTITPLVELELCSALAAKVRTKELGKEDARKIIALFRQHLDDGGFAVVPIGARQYHVARDWISGFSSSLRAPDALHLASASTHDLTMLTADKDLARAARHFKVKHKLVS